MSVKIGINGFGRIGRNYFRAALAQGSDLEIVAVNDLTTTRPCATCSSTTRSTGRSTARSSRRRHHRRQRQADQGLAERDPANLPWGELGVEIVIESTGFFTKAADAAKHIDAGAKKVIISAPATGDDAPSFSGSTSRRLRPGQPPHHLERVVHHEQPRAADEGVPRQLRRRARPHDDGPRVHRRPEPPGRPAQGPASRPRRRRSTSCRPRPVPPKPSAWSSRSSTGKLDGYRAPRPGADRLDHRPDLEKSSARHRRADQRRLQGRRGGPTSRASCSTPKTRWCRATSAPTRTRRSTTPA